LSDKIKKNKATTIKDIANFCGVSAVTVSRVLSGSNYPVSVEAKEKIVKAAKELNYQPNLFARGLKTNKSMEIAIMIPSISNPFYTSIVAGVENIALKNGYSIILYNCNNRYTSEAIIIDNIINRRIDKLVLSIVGNNPALIKKVVSKGIKVVLVDCMMPDLICNQIYFNYCKGGEVATEYLINRGHRRIAYLGLKPDRQSRNDHFEGVKEAMLRSGLKFDNDCIFVFDDQEDRVENIEFKAGFTLAKKAIGSVCKPTAIVTANDMMALGALSYFNSVSIKVPDDISMVGFDDSIFSEISHPSITTVKVPAEQMGEMAVKHLLDEIKESKSSKFNIILEPEMIERQSVSRPNPQSY
jgi:LacI family transcriptional regulator